jgi:hypothetical protein
MESSDHHSIDSAVKPGVSWADVVTQKLTPTEERDLAEYNKRCYERVESSRVTKPTLIIGFIGSVRPDFNHEIARTYIDEVMEKIIDAYEKKKGTYTIEIVSGLTNQGVPKLVYEYADKMKYPTIGFAPSRIHQIRAGMYPVTKQIIIGTNFGDESAQFLEYIDILVRIGGGPQSHMEVSEFKKLYPKNISTTLFEYELKLDRKQEKEQEQGHTQDQSGWRQKVHERKQKGWRQKVQQRIQYSDEDVISQLDEHDSDGFTRVSYRRSTHQSKE